MEVYNHLSEKYNEIFIDGIEEFYKKCIQEKMVDHEYYTFYPSFGVNKNEASEFLIVGQAVNGWDSGFYTGNKVIQSKMILTKSIEASNCYCLEYNHTPLDWVNVKWSKSLFEEHMKDEIKNKFYYDAKNKFYSCSSSFFWNVTYKLICRYYGLDIHGWDWSRKMVWTNLFKIAPVSGNPDKKEQSFQLNFSIDLLKKEIEEINPKYCIVLTNLSWWESFGKGLKTRSLKVPENLTEIVSFEKYNNTKIIVTNRPRNGPSDEYVSQILELIK